jgi:ubiquinone/menaquinone biosynthesis C-methylase UbiE
MNHDFKTRWANVDTSDRAPDYARVINQIRSTDDPAKYPNMLAFIDAQPGERVLEVGCGNGAVSRALAAHVSEVAEVVAVDYSSLFVHEAKRLLEGRDLPVRYAVADAGELPFSDGYFDRAYSMETFVILPDPRKALDEMVRVTRPGGHICIWESECDMGAISATDLELARRIRRFVGEVEYNGAVARQIIVWLREKGFEVQHTGMLGVQEKLGALQVHLYNEFLGDAVRMGVATEEEATRFMTDLHERDAAGLYFAYMPHFRITATKPYATVDNSRRQNGPHE